MAYLKRPKSQDEIKKMTVVEAKKEYSKLAEDMNRLLNLNYIYCPHCDQWLSSEAFYTTDSTASGYIHLGCKKCILGMATDYDPKTKTYTDNRSKTIDVLHKLDLPFIESLYNSSLQTTQESVGEKNRSTAWQHYYTILRSLPQYRGRHWNSSEFDEFSDDASGVNRKPRKEIIKLFGVGLSNEDYLYLQDQFDDWKNRTQVDSKSQETYIVRICFKLLDIWKAQRSGRDTDKLDKSLNELMASANLQPRQNVGNAATDQLTFGQLIEKWEQEDPIPEPSEEFKDVDGIGKYIRVWFKGAFSRAMGFDNGYSKEYDDYISKYTVTKPEYHEDGCSDDIYQALFGKDE